MPSMYLKAGAAKADDELRTTRCPAASEHTNKQASEHTNKQANTQTHKQANTQTNKQANTQTNKQTLKHTNGQRAQRTTHLKHTNTHCHKHTENRPDPCAATVQRTDALPIGGRRRRLSDLAFDAVPRRRAAEPAAADAPLSTPLCAPLVYPLGHPLEYHLRTPLSIPVSTPRAPRCVLARPPSPSLSPPRCTSVSSRSRRANRKGRPSADAKAECMQMGRIGR